jgi:hypothetical protein
LPRGRNPAAKYKVWAWSAEDNEWGLADETSSLKDAKQTADRYIERGYGWFPATAVTEAATNQTVYTRQAEGNPMANFTLTPAQKKAIDDYYKRGGEWAQGTDAKYLLEQLGEAGVVSDLEFDYHFDPLLRAIGAYAKKHEKRRPNRGRPPAGRKWVADAITRPGKLGGKGFVTKPVKTQKQILDRCIKGYGYRSCLGSVMILERLPANERHFTRLAGLRNYLVSKYGGPGTFGPRGPTRMLQKKRKKIANPEGFVLIPELTDNPPIICKVNAKFAREMEAANSSKVAAKSGRPRVQAKASRATRKKPTRSSASVARSLLRGT